MKKYCETMILCVLMMAPMAMGSECIIADHNAAADFDKIPDYWIGQAKEQFKVSYGHTSHGSQIISGINAINNQYTGSAADAVSCNGYDCNSCLYDYCDDRSHYNSSGTIAPAGTLSIFDDHPNGDLGHTGSRTWYYSTRTMLEDSRYDNRNVVMWSWCGGCSDNNEVGINTYLNDANTIETDYDVVYIYMTGHLDGGGEAGNLNVRNNQIRDYCIANDKVLFDFADIESYDPDGNYFLDKAANDECYYWVDSVRYNWADEWCAANPGECPSCSCAHSRCLNCYLKGKAFWWMMARLAGWDGCTAVDGDISGDCQVDLVDYSLLANQWLREDCTRANDWCQWADSGRDGIGAVGVNDLLMITDNWLDGTN